MRASVGGGVERAEEKRQGASRTSRRHACSEGFVQRKDSGRCNTGYENRTRAVPLSCRLSVMPAPGDELARERANANALRGSRIHIRSIRARETLCNSACARMLRVLGAADPPGNTARPSEACLPAHRALPSFRASSETLAAPVRPTIALLLAPQFFEVLICSHSTRKCGIEEEVDKEKKSK